MARFGALRSVAVLSVVTAGVVYSQSAEFLYEQGLGALRSGNFDAAIQRVRKAIALQRIYPDAYNTLGLLLGKTGQDPVSVVDAFETAIRQRPDFASAHYNLGLVLAQIGQVDSAIGELRKAVKYDPNNADAYNALGLALMDRNMDEAIGFLKRSIELKPRFIEAEFNLALAYHRKYGTEREIEQLRHVLDLDPKNLVARNTLTRRYEESGQFEDVLIFARETIRLHPDSAEAHLFAGKTLLRKAEVPEAVKHLKQAIRIDPSLGEAHYHLGVALKRPGQVEEASAEFSRADALREQQHSDIAAGIQLSEIDRKLKAGEVDAAKVLLRDLMHSKPEWPDTHIRLGKILLDEGDMLAGTHEFEEAVRIAPDDFQSCYGLGFAKARAGRYSDAVAAFVKALELRPSSVEAHYNAALALFKGNSLDQASQHAYRALDLQPESIEARSLLGAIEVELGSQKLAKGDIPNAVQNFRAAVKLAPDLPEAHQLLGAALLSADLDEAGKELQRALELRPGYFEARYNLGLAKARKKQLDEAISDFHEAILLNPSQPECHDSLGVAYAARQDFSRAVDEFKEAVRLKPDWALAQYHLGSALRLSGEARAAASAFARAQQLDPKLQNPMAP